MAGDWWDVPNMSGTHDTGCVSCGCLPLQSPPILAADRGSVQVWLRGYGGPSLRDLAARRALAGGDRAAHARHRSAPWACGRHYRGPPPRRAKVRQPHSWPRTRLTVMWTKTVSARTALLVNL
jgi:hypothetical protein